MRYHHRFITLGVLCSLLLPVAAYGQAGQRPDPNTPAGAEYQLPLDQARKNAAGGGGDVEDSSGRRGSRPGAAPLFGAGIAAVKGGRRALTAVEDSGSGAGDGRDASGDGSARSQEKGGRPGRETSSAGAAAIGPPAAPSADGDDGSATLRIVGIALAVLLAGALLGLLLRRGLRQPAP